MTPYFPERIFDGTYDARPQLQEVRPPEYQDYIRLAKELQATQEFILRNFENLKAAPNTLADLARVSGEMEKIDKKLKNLATPEEFDAYINNVEARLNKVSKKLMALQKAVAKTSLDLVALEDRVKIIEESWEKDVSAFQRYNRGEFARLKEKVEKEVATLKDSIKRLKNILV